MYFYYQCIKNNTLLNFYNSFSFIKILYKFVIKLIILFIIEGILIKKMLYSKSCLCWSFPARF